MVVKDKINGLLAKPSVEEWKNALRYAIRHEKECKECVIEAQKDVREKFAESRIINDMAKKMPELGEKVQNPKRVIYHPSIIWARMRHLGVKLLRIYEKHKL